MNKCLGYDTKLSEGEDPAQELWGMWSTPSLPLLPGQLWPRVVVPDGLPYMGQIELLSFCVQTNDSCDTLNPLKLCTNEWIVLNRIISVE